MGKREKELTDFRVLLPELRQKYIREFWPGAVASTAP